VLNVGMFNVRLPEDELKKN